MQRTIATLVILAACTSESEPIARTADIVGPAQLGTCHYTIVGGSTKVGPTMDRRTQLGAGSCGDGQQCAPYLTDDSRCSYTRVDANTEHAVCQCVPDDTDPAVCTPNDLIQGLGSNDFQTRERSSAALQDICIGDPDCIGDLQDRLYQTGDPEVRQRLDQIITACSRPVDACPLGHELGTEEITCSYDAGPVQPNVTGTQCKAVSNGFGQSCLRLSAFYTCGSDLTLAGGQPAQCPGSETVTAGDGGTYTASITTLSCRSGNVEDDNQLKQTMEQACPTSWEIQHMVAGGMSCNPGASVDTTLTVKIPVCSSAPLQVSHNVGFALEAL